jgi:Ca2+-binding RTX toxin-like protein
MPSFTGTSGRDFINPNLISAGVIAVGGLRPSAAIDTLDGGGGDDFLEGGGGADRIFGGEGKDNVVWHMGDGSDIVDGGVGLLDSMAFDANGGAETLTLSALGDHATMSLNADRVNIDNVEELSVVMWDGADRVVLNDLSLTDVRRVTVDLESFGAVPDGASDVVIINGSTTVRDSMVVALNEDGTAMRIDDTVNGFIQTTNIMMMDTSDVVTFNLGGGADGMFMAGPNTRARVTINGDAGDDVLAGSFGSETINGGANNDVIQGKTGSDRVDGGSGDDTLEWQPFSSAGDSSTLIGGIGNDTLRVNSLGVRPTGIWNIHLEASGGGHAGLDLEGASDQGIFNTSSLDLTTVENIQLTGSGQALGIFVFFDGDSFHISDLTGTGVKTVSIDLPGSIERVILDGGAGAERIVGATSATGDISFTGLPATVTLKGVEAANFMTLSGGNGSDVIDLSGVTINFHRAVFGGEGGDTITGSVGGVSHPSFNDSTQGLFGNDGDDVIVGGAPAGNFEHEEIEGGNGSDTLSGGGGDTIFYFTAGETGSVVITNFRTSGDLLAMPQKFAEIRDNNRFFESDGNVSISDGQHTIVTLLGVKLGDLSAADFLFG